MAVTTRWSRQGDLKWVRVWHGPHAPKWILYADDTDLAEVVEAWPKNFKPVATISSRRKQKGLLDVAWNMTNAVNYHWSDPRNFPGLHRTFKLKVENSGARSSMVGDIFETNDERLFIVLSIGFREVPHPAMVAKIPREELPLYLHKDPVLNRMIERRLKGV